MARVRVILIGELFFPNFSTFVLRNLLIFHIFLFFFSKYWNVNELDIFCSGEFHAIVTERLRILIYIYIYLQLFPNFGSYGKSALR